MKLYTAVDLPRSPWLIRHSDKLMLLGSCFADNIGARLSRAGFQVKANPLGTLYNPASVAEVLTRLLDGRLFELSDIRHFGAEGWGTWMSHSLLSRPTAEEALQIHNERITQAAKQLRDARVLLITFGTAWGYRLKSQQVNKSTSQQTEDEAQQTDADRLRHVDSLTRSLVDLFVANCHHEPSSAFERERLTTDDIVSLWQPLLQRLAAEQPELHILFTVSPIRHLRDGAHANQLSKATLLLAVEELIGSQQVNTSYFPSYEIVLDELRDYRFYADDMAHPSPLAIDYLWERFADTFFDDATRRNASRIEEVVQALEHRPLHPESDEYRRFLRQTLLKIEDIQKEIPYFESGKLIDRCHTLLNS